MSAINGSVQLESLPALSQVLGPAATSKHMMHTQAKAVCREARPLKVFSSKTVVLNFRFFTS
eukprot:2072424-Amphidinium_carterae.1